MFDPIYLLKAAYAIAISYFCLFFMVIVRKRVLRSSNFNFCEQEIVDRGQIRANVLSF